MGLDLVELVMRVEEEFGVDISDEEAESATTVGALHQLVVNKCSIGDLKTCITSAAFYRTRRALVQALGVERKSVRPTTQLDELFPENDPVRRWKRFENASALRIPEVETGWFLRGNIFPAGTVGDLSRRVAAFNDRELRAECGG